MSVQPKLALPHFTFENNLIFSYLENMHPEIRKSFVATCHLQNIQSLFLSKKKKKIQRLQDTIKAFCRIITFVINSNWCITGDVQRLFPTFSKRSSFLPSFSLNIYTYIYMHTHRLFMYLSANHSSTVKPYHLLKKKSQCYLDLFTSYLFLLSIYQP